MTTFGAVKVGGRNFFRLLKNGEAVLLFPGGVREVRLQPPAPCHCQAVVSHVWPMHLCKMQNFKPWHAGICVFMARGGLD